MTDQTENPTSPLAQSEPNDISAAPSATAVPSLGTVPDMPPMTYGTGLAAEQVIDLVNHALAAGFMTPEQAKEVLAAEGVEAEIGPIEEPTVWDTEFPGVKDPAEINFGDAAKELGVEGMQRLGQAAVASNITAADASELVRIGHDIEARYDQMSDAGKELWLAEQWQLTVKHLGNGDEVLTEERIATIGGFLEALDEKSPGIREAILNSPVADDHRFIVRAWMHIERMIARHSELEARGKNGGSK